MATRAELYRPPYGWIQSPKIEPGDNPGSFVHVQETGRVRTYLFKPTPDDSSTVIGVFDGPRQNLDKGKLAVPTDQLRLLTTVSPADVFEKEIVDEEGKWGIVVIRHEN